MYEITGSPTMRPAFESLVFPLAFRASPGVSGGEVLRVPRPWGGGASAAKWCTQGCRASTLREARGGPGLARV